MTDTPDENRQPSPEPNGFKPITTQEELDRIITGRIERAVAKAKPADYDEVKAKAEQFDQLQEAGQSAAERITELEAEVSTLAGQLADKDAAVLRAEVAADKGVPAKYLTGGTREEIEASAVEFLADVGQFRKPGYVPTAGTGPAKVHLSSLEAGREAARAKHQ